LFLGVCRAYTAKDRPADAERILALLLKHRPETPGLPAACQRLAATWQRLGKPDRMDRCRQILVRRFPQSPEAAEIRQAGN